MSAGPLSIGELSRATGLAVSAIRYYEARGLVRPAGRVGGKRVFDPAAVDRLRLVGLVKQAGFNLDEVALLLGPDGADVAARRRLVDAKLAEVRDAIRRLEGVAAALERARECRCTGLDACDLLARARPRALA